MHRFIRTVFLITYCAAMSALVGIARPLPVPRDISLHDITLKELIPPLSSHKQFQITEGKDRGRIVPFIFQPDLVDEKNGGSCLAIMRRFSC